MKMNKRIMISCASMTMVMAMIFVPSASALNLGRTVHFGSGCNANIAFMSDGNYAKATTTEINNCSQVKVWFRYVSQGVVKNSTISEGPSYAESAVYDYNDLVITMHEGTNNNWWSVESLYKP